MSEALEALGVLCIIAFCFAVWPPLALMPAGVALIVAGFALDGIVIGRKKNKP